MIVSSEDLSKMIVAATALGWKVPVPEADWPESFDRDGKTWTKDSLTVAQKTGEVQCGEYVSGDGYLVVYNE